MSLGISIERTRGPIAALAVAMALMTSPVRATVTTIVVTAEPILSAKAMALDKAIGQRLTPQGKAFVLRESVLLNNGTRQPADAAPDARHDCATSFTPCGKDDATKLEFHVLAAALFDTSAIFSSGIDRAVFEKAAKSAEPFLARNDFAGYRAAIFANLPPLQRGKFAIFRARGARIRLQMCETLKILGIPDGCVYNPSH